MAFRSKATNSGSRRVRPSGPYPAALPPSSAYNNNRPARPSPLSFIPPSASQPTIVPPDEDSSGLRSPGLAPEGQAQIRDTLKSFPLFKDAPEDFLNRVATKLRPQVHQPRDEIISEGEDAKAMYFIIRGSVFVTSRDGESYYAELRSGAYFGEIGVLFSVPRTASIIAQTRTLTLALSASSLHSILPSFPPLETAMRHEAESRLAILKQQQSVSPFTPSFNLREAIAQLKLFRGLTEDALHVLCMSVRSRIYAPFTNILVEGRAAPEREIYFIMQGEVEVLSESNPPEVKARLGSGEYFGELAFLDPFARRTATVRSITRTTCLVLEGKAMKEVALKFPHVEIEIQRTAKERMQENQLFLATKVKAPGDMEVEGLVGGVRGVEIARDVDPFIPVLTDEDFETIEKPSIARSRRSSLKPPESQSLEPSHGAELPPVTREQSSLKHQLSSYNLLAADRGRQMSQSPTKRLKRLSSHTGRLPKHILLRVFGFLTLPELMRLRLVCHAWQHILQSAPELVIDLDLSPYNKRITDIALASIARFINGRPKFVDISNCFHVSDTGFLDLVRGVSPDLRIWRMKSVWDVSGHAIGEISQRCPNLEDIDLSNCRKVGDATLSRIVGNAASLSAFEKVTFDSNGSCVRRLTLSYCKHLTDRFMAHLANNQHVAARLEALNISRCTTITDWGFQTWSVTSGGGRFSSLSDLKLSDCTFLTDQAIVYLVNAAPNLRNLDLSFCCALSDTSVEVIALSLPRLQYLNLAFCGSAVSDNSIRTISLHLGDLREISVRGCVRVTRSGVETLCILSRGLGPGNSVTAITAVVEGGGGNSVCEGLQKVDLSQCRNFTGGSKRWWTSVSRNGRIKFVL